MNNALKFAIAAAAVVVVALVGINLLPGGSGPGGPATSPSAAPSSTPLPSPAAASPRPLENDALTAGRYSLPRFPLGISFEVPAGWSGCSENEVEQGVCLGSLNEVRGIVGFSIVENVVTDPCASPRTLLVPAVGPSVDDLVTAISNLKGFEVTTLVDYTLDGFHGKQFTLTTPTTATCADYGTWATALRINGMGPGEINDVRILDVGGARLLIANAYGPGQPAEDKAAVQQVVDSVQIEP